MIYGIGLPRTGTTTLAEALRLMGLQGSSYCTLRNILREDASASFVVDNTIHERIFELYNNSYNTDKFILTNREINRWHASMNKFNASAIPTVIEYCTYIQSLINPNQLLIVDWEMGHGWEELSNFLGIPQPDYAFPCANC